MIIKKSNGEIICENAILADDMFARMKGLMFSSDLAMNTGLLIKPCNSIHTFFMNYSLDIVFMDSNFKIVKVIYNMVPWRISAMYFKASQVLEMKAGSLQKDLMSGEKLEVVCSK